MLGEHEVTTFFYVVLENPPNRHAENVRHRGIVADLLKRFLEPAGLLRRSSAYSGREGAPDAGLSEVEMKEK
jgi:hypothetical protein